MKRIFPIAIVLTLVGCTSTPEVTKQDAIESVQIDTAVCSLYSPTLYGEEFLQSDFFDAWKYEKGVGREINIDKAMALYKKSVDKRKYANLASLHNDYILLQRKNLTYTEAAFDSGWVFSYIRSGEKDDFGKLTEEEARWLAVHSLCGEPTEQYAVGLLNINGDFFKRDVNTGVYFLTLAAKQGHYRAQTTLGLALAERGETQAAIDWLTLAKKNGSPNLEGMIQFLENTK